MNIDTQTIAYSPFEPIPDYAPLFINSMISGGLQAFEFTGWRDETISWKETCYLHAGLNATHTLKIKGADTFKFLHRICVNSFEKFPIGSIKQGVMCNSKGLVTDTGVILRIGEDEVISYWMMSMLSAFNSGVYGKYEIEIENLTGKVFLLQIAGPTSINTLESATGQSLRELKFLRSMDAVIADKPVKIYRLGMAGTLAYEAHGALEDALDVYNAIYEAGIPFGIRRLGNRSYPMNHSENGFPQTMVHFFPASVDYDEANIALQLPVYGSLSDNVDNFFHNPYELGWGKVVKFDHDFVGREALEKIAAENKRILVSLEWNVEDIADVFASQFRDEVPFKYIESPRDPDTWFGGVSHDMVVNEKGEMIGMSFGRQNSAYFHCMISICCLDVDYAQPGSEIMVVWGEPGARQKKIRAKVARYPYNNILRNENTDVTLLPITEQNKRDGDLSLEGRYNVIVNTPMGKQDGSFDYKVDDGVLTGTATAMGATTTIENGEVDGDNFSHTIIMNKMKIKVSGIFDGNIIKGEFKLPIGKAKFFGTRVK